MSVSDMDEKTDQEKVDYSCYSEIQSEDLSVVDAK